MDPALGGSPQPEHDVAWLPEGMAVTEKRTYAARPEAKGDSGHSTECERTVYAVSAGAFVRKYGITQREHCDW
jgi:hypothetical protein